MATYTFHPANTRGSANHGWLNAHHSFSFASYYNPERIHFGALRVLNDDLIAPGMGFGRHPHDNMEIITIPLSGSIRHKDSMGNEGVVNAGEIQVMSAGSGVEHSEHNNSKTDELSLFQIWLFPREKNVAPRYQQLNYADHSVVNQLQQILSPNAEDDGVWIHQDAWFHIGQYEENQVVKYQMKKEGNLLYIMVISGQFSIDNYVLNNRDAIGIADAHSIELISQKDDNRILIMELPQFMV